MAASGVSVDATDSEASFFLHQQKQQHCRIASWLLLSLLLSFCRHPCRLFCPVFSAKEEKLRASAIIRVGRTRQTGTVDTMYWFSSLDSLALFSFYIFSPFLALCTILSFYFLVMESSSFFFPSLSLSQQVSLFFRSRSHGHRPAVAAAAAAHGRRRTVPIYWIAAGDATASVTTTVLSLSLSLSLSFFFPIFFGCFPSHWVEHACQLGGRLPLLHRSAFSFSIAVDNVSVRLLVQHSFCFCSFQSVSGCFGSISQIWCQFVCCCCSLQLMLLLLPAVMLPFEC